MKEFHFNHLKASFSIIVSLAVVILGLFLLRQGIHYESKVLVDTNGILFIIAGSIIIVYGFIETRLVWIAISFPVTKIIVDNNQIKLLEKTKEINIEFPEIKKVTFYEREDFTRKSISTDIGFTKIETYDQGYFIITTLIANSKTLNDLIKISSSKKFRSERKPFKKIS